MTTKVSRHSFRCLLLDWEGKTLCTSIAIDVPPGLTRQQAFDYVAGVCAREIARYAAAEALGITEITRETDWKEIVT